MPGRAGPTGRVPGPVGSLTDSPGQTCRWRCRGPAAGEPFAPRRTVSVEDLAVRLCRLAVSEWRRRGGGHLAAPPPGLLGAQLLLQVLDQGVFGALDVVVCGAGGRRPRSDRLLQDGFRKTGGEKEPWTNICGAPDSTRVSSETESEGLGQSPSAIQLIHELPCGLSEPAVVNPDPGEPLTSPGKWLRRPGVQRSLRFTGGFQTASICLLMRPLDGSS